VAPDSAPGATLASLRTLDLPPGYDSGDDVLNSFYVPALQRATSYSRSVGYFRSSSLSVAAKGLSRFVNGKGTVRLLCGAELREEDVEALQGGVITPGPLADRLAAGLVTSDEIARRRIEVLAWLVKEKRLVVRIAIAVDEQGKPLVGDGAKPYFHEKIGILRDDAQDAVVFQGSVNESATAWTRNFESFSVYSSWGEAAAHFAFWSSRFEKRWNGQVPGFRVYPLPEAVEQALVARAPDTVPGERDPDEPPPVGEPNTVTHFIHAAPRLPWAGDLAEATSGVRLFPHQRQNVARLAGMYPRSWLVADEVGLGKTISAGMSLRQLVLNGEVAKALVLAPANVCRQWQDELFEKFALWVPRLDQGKIYGAHPDDVQPAGANAYAEHPLLLASSHLARRPEQQKLVLAAAPYDLLIVDEAHHARRNHANEDRYRPSRLLELLDRVNEQNAARAVWLMTATPLQTNAVELVDLLRQTGLSGPLTDQRTFIRFYAELAKSDTRKIAWSWLAEQVRRTPSLPRTGAEDNLAADLERRLGHVTAEMVVRFGFDDADPAQRIEAIGEDGRQALRTWLRALSPVSQYVARHSRATLKAYAQRGLIAENLADRDVLPEVVHLLPDEQQLYNDLEQLIDRLLEANGKRRGAGFVLTVYRRRLTSSWAAIHKTLQKRLASEESLLDQTSLDDTADDSEDEDGALTVKESGAVPLTSKDLQEMQNYAFRISQVHDSKFEALERHLDQARGNGHSTIVFTQFTDTLDALRDRLHHKYRSQLGTFTGDGGRVFRESDGWTDISKRDLVEAIKARAVTVLLATDAASEGLNLQTCSYLINYDMPWNPMRVEQRIGRVDRLGQTRDTVVVRNFFIAGTVEEEVYKALASRIDLFTGIVGGLQPILGAVEGAFRDVFKAAASERAAAREAGIRALLKLVESNPGANLPLDVDEDPLPIPNHVPSAVTLADLRDVVIERLGAVLDEPGRPITTDPVRVSRDPESWVALATYGHPRLDHVLAAHSSGDTSLVMVEASARGPAVAMRSDTVPPRPAARLVDVDDLGPSVSRSEAEAMAEVVLARAITSRRARYEAVGERNRQDARERLRTRFTDLARTILADAAAAARAAGTTTEPALLWLDLKDETGTLRYLDAVRDQLGVGKALLLRPAGDDDRLLDEVEWSRRKHSHSERLRLLAADIRQLTSDS
jgi:superfamily II DNA or RNA helicase